MIRQSNYEIIVPLLDNENALLIHGLYGSVDIISSKYINSSHFAKSELFINNIPETICQHLVSRGHLTEKTASMEEAVMEKFAEKYEQIHSRGSIPPRFVFVITYDCNLKCVYCFQRNLKQNFPSSCLTSVQIETIFNYIHTFPDKLSNRRIIELYGGEPLQQKNHHLIETIISKASAINYSISATSNGYELDSYIDLLGPDKIGEIIVTLDGPPQVHNRRRVATINRPTFSKIVGNIDRALKHDVNIALRVNIDNSNLNNLPDLANIIESNGWFHLDNFQMFCATVKPFPNMPPVKHQISEAELFDFLIVNEMDNPILSNIAVGKGNYNLFKSLTDNEIFTLTKTRNCGAVNPNLYFSPDGLVYSCHEAVGRPEFSIGNYGDNLVQLNKKQVKKWCQRRIPFIKACRRCPFVFLCAGGCAYRILNSTKDELTPFCGDFAVGYIKAIQRDYRSVVVGDR